MTPKGKARELVMKFYNYPKFSITKYVAKDYALMTVNEILDGDNLFVTSFKENQRKYWEEVKKEIEKQ